MENVEQYQYQPLPRATSIRLLQLHPGPGPSEFSCSLEVVDISDPPEYAALSYVWGDQKVPVLCHGRTVLVPLNLRVALERFREVSTYHWADALCIDQSNKEEKNQQVKMMGDIYKKATMVAVWLGLDEKGYARLVFDDMYALVEGLATVHNSGGKFKHVDEETGDLHWVHGDGSHHVSALPPVFVDPSEQELARLKWFFCLPWFSRTWVLQEVGLASFVALMCGELGAEWHGIGIVALFLVRHCRTLMERLGLAAEVKRVYHLYTAFSPFIPTASFFHLLDNARRFKAQDERDQIFALLSHPTSRTISMSASVRLENVAGFEPYRKLAIHFLPDSRSQYVARTSSTLPSPSTWQLKAPLFEVDYNTPFPEVYRSFALDHIRRTSSLEILTAVQHDPTSTSLTNSLLPTWVPRWDVFHDIPILGLYNSQHIASGNKDAIVNSSPSSSPSTLTVRGILLDTIRCHTCVLHTSDFDLPLPTTTTTPLTPDSEPVQRLWTSCPIARVWLHAATVDADSYPQLSWLRTGSSPFAAYRATWVAEKNLDNVDGFRLAEDFQAYWNRLFWGTQKARMTESNRQQQRPKDKDVDDENRDDDHNEGDDSDEKGENAGSWQRYRDSAAYVCNKRKFFITWEGFFGIGPGALLDGDVVAVLLGADVPFVLRRVRAEEGEAQQDGEEGKYQLVGECCVRGLMQGQAIKARLEQRDFVLV